MRMEPLFHGPAGRERFCAGLAAGSWGARFGALRATDATVACGLRLSDQGALMFAQKIFMG